MGGSAGLETLRFGDGEASTFLIREKLMSRQNHMEAVLKTILLSLTISFFSTAFAATPRANSMSPAVSSAEVASRAESPGKNEPETQEIAVLKAQLSTMQEFQSDLISTVHWSLGGILTALVLFVGYGWYSHKKVNDKEIELAASKLEQRLKDGLQEAEKKIDQRLNATSQAIKDAVAEQSKETLKETNASIKRIRSDVADHWNEFRWHRAEADVRYYQAQGVAGNVFSSLLQQLEVVKEMRGYEWKIDTILDDMTRLLRKHPTAADAMEKSDCLALLNTLDARHEINVAALKRALSTG